MNFKIYLKLIRIENLLLVAFMQLLVKYSFFNYIHFKDALGEQKALLDWQSLTDVQYLLFVLATILIMAGGYIINNIYDVDSDTVNKPDDVIVSVYISEKLAYNLYFILTFLGVGIGFYLSRVIQKPVFASVFVISAALLYVYSNGLKQIPILGNAVIALLAALSILNISFFNILPAIYSGNEQFMKTITSILFDYSIFAFLLHFSREIIKTVEDIEGDSAYEISTVATTFGIKIAKIITSLSLFVLIVYLGYYIIENLSHNLYTVAYFTLFIIFPLLFVIIKLIKADKKADFTLLSKFLKLIMLPLILSLSVILITMQYA